MKYTVFREQVADQFGIGSQDVCIVGSAKLGFSPSPVKYGTDFSKASDVDVVLVSFELFDRGSRYLFEHLNHIGPNIRADRASKAAKGKDAPDTIDIQRSDWRSVKDAIRNYTYQNFNPALLEVAWRIWTGG